MKKKTDNTKKIVALALAAAGVSFLFIKSRTALADANNAVMPDFVQDFFNGPVDVTASSGVGNNDINELVINGCMCPGDPGYIAHFLKGGARCNAHLCTGPNYSFGGDT